MYVVLFLFLIKDDIFKGVDCKNNKYPSPVSTQRSFYT